VLEIRQIRCRVESNKIKGFLSGQKCSRTLEGGEKTLRLECLVSLLGSADHGNDSSPERERMKAQEQPKPKKAFDLKDFLSKASGGTRNVDCSENGAIFSQGDPANAIFYIQKGKVKLTVLSRRGKEAVIAILGAGDFFGEGCLAGQPLRMATAVCLSGGSIMRLEKAKVIRVLHEQSRFSELFVAHLLSRNVRIEEDLVDQLFNSSEKRLARVLLLLANFGKEGTPQTVIPKMSQETLAGIIGTTRSRVSFFMNRFRKLGFIHYNGGLTIHSSLLNVVLHD
jgi:CRP/FNR family transcriptional regulator, cyclic AMP receptor protein